MEHRSRYWVWPIPPLKSKAAAQLLSLALSCDFGSRIGLLAAMILLAGVFPVALAYIVELPIHQWLTTIAFFPIFLGCVASRSPLRGFLALVSVIAIHSVMVIGLSYAKPSIMAQITPGAEPFWQESLHWIRTGEQLEYRLDIWLPKHLLLIAAVAVLGYCSLGFTVLHRGFEEVDLMNYYVGRLLAQSDYAAVALLGGWHIWSLCRGAGYAILIFEISSFSFHRLIQSDEYQIGPSLRRCAIGIAFLALDVLCKFFLMEPVRQMLDSHLLR